MASEDKKETVAETKEVKEETTPTENSKSETKDKDIDTSAPPAEPAPPKPTVKKVNYEKDVVYLYQFPRTSVIPSISPYCLKVETWLRLAGLKYENVDHKVKHRSKKGQLPFVELNGEEIADSSFIIKELGKKFGKDLDATLTNEQKNNSHALISMIENHFLWVMLWWKTKNPDDFVKGYKLNLQTILNSKMPIALLNIFFKFSYCRKGAKKAKAQGIGVHTPEEIIDFGKNDLKVLTDVLGEKPYFFGNDPTTLDVVVFANLAQLYFLDSEIKNPLREYLNESCANLVGHVNRMKERCFPDWDDICTNLDLNSHLPKPPPEEKDKAKEGEKKAEKEAENGKEKSEKESEKEPEDKEKEKDAK
ncbi:failed axon connections [Bemisia tabaci]|uniref:failed axon connections n=1 Tax=Bemisia tabaci TaxID=7038 RepID=UPI0008F9C0AF|nr:PREDICTED: failed axon connections [Bemisia tabaci]